MKNIKKIIIPVVIVAAVAGLFVLGNRMSIDRVAEGLRGTEITVFRSPTCGCCGNYVDYLKRSGFEVSEVTTEDMELVKEEHGVPYSLESCHTSVVDGYVVEGHIPVEVISQLLTERPDIAGIALAGMPSGSPGMPGAKYSPFEVHALTEEGGDGGLFVSF